MLLRIDEIVAGMSKRKGGEAGGAQQQSQFEAITDPDEVIIPVQSPLADRTLHNLPSPYLIIVLLYVQAEGGEGQQQ